MGLCALVALGCSLEEALGVDEGSASGDATGQDPDGGPGTGDGQDDDTTGAGSATATDDSSDGGPDLPPSCGGRTVRVAAYNTETVGAPGSAEFESLAAIIERIDADVICLEEVQYWESDRLLALADATGYADVIQADQSPAIGGDHTNACMSRDGGLELVGSWSGWDLSPDPDANDVGRHILVVQVDFAQEQPAPCRMGFVSLHLKSEQEEVDWFRRQVEAERTVQAVGLYRAMYPDDPMVILGDFNENLGDPALGTVFTGPPPDGQLPGSYHLGSDIEFPLTYQPFDRFEGIGFSIVPATQEDSSRDETWSDFVRLDYVLHAGTELMAAEVYNACRDDGVGGLPKAGEPLPCTVSDPDSDSAASDHFPVVADLVVP